VAVKGRNIRTLTRKVGGTGMWLPLSMVAALLFPILSSAAHASGSSEASFADRIKYVGIAVTDPSHHVWGCSPIVDEDGKIHLFGARWKSPFDPGWRTDSHIVHFVADKPEGPFKFAEVIYRGERKEKGQWNYFGVCNPAIKKVDGKYVLLFIANSNATSRRGRKNSPAPANQSIGMMTADTLDGPWSKPRPVLTPSKDSEHWTYQAGNGVCNPAFLKFKGKYYLYYKSANAKYGVAIANKLEGPYLHHPESVTKNDKTIEDGINFSKPSRGFYPLEHYAPRSRYPNRRKIYRPPDTASS